MNRFFRLFTLTALCLFATLAKAGTYYQYIYITCVDKHGNIIGRDTIKTPAGECFYLKAPSIPYYKCIDYSEVGSNVCIHTSEHLTMQYETTGFSGFSQLSNEAIDELAEDQSVVLLTPEDQPRVWCTADSSKVKLLPLSAEGHSPAATWIMRSTDNGWSFYNEMGNCYIADILPDGTARTGDRPMAFSIVKDGNKKSNQHILHTADGRVFAVRLSKYRPRIYFGLSASFVDEKDSLIAPDRFLPIPAGTDYTFKAPALRGFKFVSSPDIDEKEPIHLNDFLGAQLVYRPAPSGISSAKRTQHLLSGLTFDLSGRRLFKNARETGAAGHRLVIVDGKLQLQP